ncbi:protein kinase [Leptolyngbya sp. FACHB-671]|uniref:protein kinase domain-containing protein n=1 Tax=Leptolyngbya sp. FACHB-671 TaxID=2692812 RepID=UPI0018F01F1F|nr:protein kinase [Leptolyngbya sp. FACHB-671]
MDSQAPLLKRGNRALAAIVITDSVGFSARMSSDEEHTLNLIQRDLQMMRQICQNTEGQVLKSTGDGLLMYFVSAVQAVACAMKIQTTIAEQADQRSPEDVLIHRIGIHLGDVFFSETDVMGNGVNIAARLQTEAKPGGICISQTVYDVVKDRLVMEAVYAGPLKLKNIQQPVPAYQILPARHSDATSVHPLDTSAPSYLLGSASEETLLDTIIDGRYQIHRVLGRGGFGRTYLASDMQRFGDLCVLKEFVPTSRADYTVQKSRQLFEQEARVLYEIQHPQIPRFLAWFAEKGRLFLVQEYIDGKTYATLLREKLRQGAVFSEAEVTRWLADLLPVLEYLHSLNIVHRDISPDNVMLPDGQTHPMLIDFGLVKQAVNQIWAAYAEDGSTVSQASFVGKLGYAPPEQIRMGQCYPCSDLYALGVTALVLLTGQEPNTLTDRDSLEWCWQSYVQVSDRLTQILNKMLSEKPKDRYQSAAEVMTALGLTGAASSPLSNPSVRSSRPTSNVTQQQRSPIPPPKPLPVLDPKFVERCRTELARCIGPMADYIVEDILSQTPHLKPEQLVQAIAAEIPNSKQAEAFQQKLRSR